MMTLQGPTSPLCTLQHPCSARFGLPSTSASSLPFPFECFFGSTQRGWLFRLVASNFHHAEVQSEAPTCPPCLAWIHNLLKINHNQRHMPGDDSELIFILDNLVFLPKYSSFQPSPSLVRGLNDLGVSLPSTLVYASLSLLKYFSFFPV